MKALVLSHISELLGGAERSMLDVFDAWAKERGVTPEFIVRKPVKSLGGEFDKRGWKYHAVEYTFWSDGRPPESAEAKFKQAAANARAVFEIEGIIKSSKPDIVMTNSVVCPWAAIAAYFQGVPHVWFVREYGDLDHGRIYEIGRAGTLADVGTMSDIVATISEALARHLGNYMDPAKLQVLYNPFNMEEISAKAAESVPSPYRHDGCLKLVITGNLAPSKGQLDVIEAVGELVQDGKNIELCVIGAAGEADYMAAIGAAIKQFGIADRVHLLGRQANPLAYVAMADVGIMTSRMEGFGRVTFEYITLGKPVVGANSGATPEIVPNGKAGTLYTAGDNNELIKAIRGYAEHPERIAAHGAYALAHARSMMTGEYTAKKLFDRVDALLKHPPAPKVPLHYAHAWLEYTQLAEQYLQEAGAVSLKNIVRQRGRRKLKRIYQNVRTSVAKRTGK